MDITNREAAAVVKERLATQRQIFEQFGRTLVDLKVKDLCQHCSVLNCSLIPLTSKGADCPYFLPKGGK